MGRGMAANSSNSLLDALRHHRLLEAKQLDELSAAPPSDAKELARDLIGRGWLTPYQANQLLNGKGHELILGSYILLQRLGEGGMGQVFKARHRNLGRIAAIKLIKKERLENPDAIRRFQREVRSAAALSHPNIVRAYDADEIAGTHLMVMEYIDGAIDLAKVVKNNGPLPIERACEYIRQAALGLQHASERGLVHRDIKPANLLLTSDGKTVKVLDMGLARLEHATDDGESSNTMTQEGVVMGTPDYMAPEQAVDTHTVDVRADLYSLGCSLYFLLTGRVPFPGGTLLQKLNKHQNSEPLAVGKLRPEVTPALARVVRKLMAKKPEERYQAPAEAAADLEAVSASLTGFAAARVAAAATAAEQNPRSKEASTLAYINNSTDTVTLDAAKKPNSRRWLIVTAGTSMSLLLGLTIVVLLIPRGAQKKNDGPPDGQKEFAKGGAQKKNDGPLDGQKEFAKGPDRPIDDKPVEKAKMPVADPDRQAAAYVVSVGGSVQVNVNGLDRDLKAAAELPKERFTLSRVNLAGAKVTDSGLASFEGCKGLTFIHLAGASVTNAGLAHLMPGKDLWFLELWGAPITDAGLAHFKGCTKLGHLSLFGTAVTDAGLAYFKDSKGLGHLNLGNTAVTDAGLACFKDCKDLGHLNLSGTAVTDAGLAYFKDCNALKQLDLHGTKVTGAGLASFKNSKGLGVLDLSSTGLTDAGLAHLKDCQEIWLLNLPGTAVTDAGLAQFAGYKGLGHLNLHGTKVTDAGLAHFKDCKGLGYLGLFGTAVTDAGLTPFQDCKGLGYLGVRDTKVTAKGRAAFHAAVPGCKIEHDGGTIEPKK
jgi:serine/threonine protein kinase